MGDVENDFGETNKNNMIDTLERNKKFIEESVGKDLNSMNKLNIACGQDYREGWVNADLGDYQKQDIEVDMTKLPLPFNDNKFDYIYCMHSLEHIPGDLVNLIIEFRRILKTNGVLEIRVPHFSHYTAQTCLTHKSVFSIMGLKAFFKYSWERGVPNLPRHKGQIFNVIKSELKYQRYEDGLKYLANKGFYYYFARFITFLANKNINLCERVWCYWVGGFQEMQIVLQKVKFDEPTKT